jgi:hypothetical protein
MRTPLNRSSLQVCCFLPQYGLTEQEYNIERSSIYLKNTKREEPRHDMDSDEYWQLQY